jgi:hypothetical protein
MWVNGFWTSGEPATHLLFRASRVNGCHVEAQHVKRRPASQGASEGRQAGRRWKKKRKKKSCRQAGSPALLSSPNPNTRRLQDERLPDPRCLQFLRTTPPLELCCHTQNWNLVELRDLPTSCNYVKPNNLV